MKKIIIIKILMIIIGIIVAPIYGNSVGERWLNVRSLTIDGYNQLDFPIHENVAIFDILLNPTGFDIARAFEEDASLIDEKQLEGSVDAYEIRLEYTVDFYVLGFAGAPLMNVRLGYDVIVWVQFSQGGSNVNVIVTSGQQWMHDYYFNRTVTLRFVRAESVPLIVTRPSTDFERNYNSLFNPRNEIDVNVANRMIDTINNPNGINQNETIRLFNDVVMRSVHDAMMQRLLLLSRLQWRIVRVNADVITLWATSSYRTSRANVGLRQRATPFYDTHLYGALNVDWVVLNAMHRDISEYVVGHETLGTKLWVPSRGEIEIDWGLITPGQRRWLSEDIHGRAWLRTNEERVWSVGVNGGFTWLEFNQTNYDQERAVVPAINICRRAIEQATGRAIGNYNNHQGGSDNNQGNNNSNNNQGNENSNNNQGNNDNNNNQGNDNYEERSVGLVWRILAGTGAVVVVMFIAFKVYKVFRD